MSSVLDLSDLTVHRRHHDQLRFLSENVSSNLEASVQCETGASVPDERVMTERMPSDLEASVQPEMGTSAPDERVTTERVPGDLEASVHTETGTSAPESVQTERMPRVPTDTGDRAERAPTEGVPLTETFVKSESLSKLETPTPELWTETFVKPGSLSKLKTPVTDESTVQGVPEKRSRAGRLYRAPRKLNL